MALLRTLFWFAIFVLSTFVFTVLFEHGVSNFSENAQQQWHSLMESVTGGGKKDAAKPTR